MPTKDRVCGMDVVPGQAAGGSAEFEGVTYWFCSSTCRGKFVADPVTYVSPMPSAPIPTSSAPPPVDTRIYTCPMHPEVRQKGAATGPKCGMALEPESGPRRGGPNPELVDMTRRFWISLALTVPVLVLAMGEMVARLGAGLADGQLWLSSRSRRRSCSGAAGRSSCAAGSRSSTAPQHVHAHRARHRGRVRFSVVATLAPGRASSTRCATAVRRRLLRGRRGHRHTRAARSSARASRPQRHRRARSVRCWAWPRRRRAAYARRHGGGRGARECKPGIGFACARARMCRSTAWSFEGGSAVDESMLTGEPIPVEKAAATGDRGHGERHRRLRHACGARRQRHAARADRADGRRGAAQPRAHPAAGRRRRRRGSSPPWCWSRS